MPSRHCAAGFGNISQPRYALLTNDEQNVMENRMWKEVSRVMLAALLAVILVAPASAQTREQAKRIYDRLAGVPPTEAVLTAMENNPGTDPVCQQNNVSGPKCAAYMAMENASFYNVTLKNFAAPWTNRDRSVFVPLNDYIATVIGMIRDDVDFRTVLSADMQYVGSGVSPAPAANNNSHYEALEAGDYNLKTVLQPALQSNINRLPPDATAGVITSRAAAEAFFIAGTNRAMFRFTMVNHFCKDMEQLHDPRLSPDRIRQDVSRSPGGDSRLFLNNCVGCHTGMDPMAQAFAYYDYNETDGTALCKTSTTTTTSTSRRDFGRRMTTGQTTGALDRTATWISTVHRTPPILMATSMPMVMAPSRSASSSRTAPPSPHARLRKCSSQFACASRSPPTTTRR
jgi:hypothetical protein